jgi:hypothetical protein
MCAHLCMNYVKQPRSKACLWHFSMICLTYTYYIHVHVPGPRSQRACMYVNFPRLHATHTYIHIHTCMHAHVHIHPHTPGPTFSSIYMQHIHTYTHTHTHTHTYVHAHAHTHTHAYIPGPEISARMSVTFSSFTCNTMSATGFLEYSLTSLMSRFRTDGEMFSLVFCKSNVYVRKKESYHERIKTLNVFSKKKLRTEPKIHERAQGYQVWPIVIQDGRKQTGSMCFPTFPVNICRFLTYMRDFSRGWHEKKTNMGQSRKQKKVT